MGDKIADVTVVLLVISWVVVSMRCGVRVLIVKSFGLDDWLMLLSQVSFTVWCVYLLLGAQAGMGHHMATLTPERIRLAMKYWYVCGFMYSLTTTITKIAVGFFLLRVIVHPVQKYVIWGMLVVSTGYGIFMCIGTSLQCNPPAKFWDPEIEGTCGNKIGGVWTGYLHAAISAVVDFIMAGIPFFMLRHSNLGVKRRIAIYLIMSLGSYAAIATLIRVGTIDDLAKNDDYLYNITGITIWSAVEPGVGIIAASLATLRPLFRVVFEATGLSNKSSGGTTRTPSSNPRFDPDVDLDELRRGEGGVSTTRIEAGQPRHHHRSSHHRSSHHRSSHHRHHSRRHNSSSSDSGQPVLLAPPEVAAAGRAHGGRRSLDSANSELGWRSYGSEEHLQTEGGGAGGGGPPQIKRSVQVTVQTSDAADYANDIHSARSPTVKRVL